MSKDKQKKVNEFMQKYIKLAAKDGYSQEKLEAYAYTQAVKLVAAFELSPYPRGLSFRDAIVAGIL